MRAWRPAAPRSLTLTLGLRNSRGRAFSRALSPHLALLGVVQATASVSIELAHRDQVPARHGSAETGLTRGRDTIRLGERKACVTHEQDLDSRRLCSGGARTGSRGWKAAHRGDRSSAAAESASGFGHHDRLQPPTREVPYCRHEPGTAPRARIRRKRVAPATLDATQYSLYQLATSPPQRGSSLG